MQDSATVTVYRHGLTGGIAPQDAGGNPGKRGRVRGWSASASRSNARFLYSVREHELSGHGLALSLTLADMPPHAEDWRAIRQRFLVSLRRLGLIRAHWVVEWQARGVPHLHLACWFPHPQGTREACALDAEVLDAWQRAAARSGNRAGLASQHSEQIDAVLGWLQYLSKHAARGADHYQRARLSIPEGWDSSGRLWGHLGQWPRDPEQRHGLTLPEFYRFRRLIRSAKVAKARTLGNRGMIRAARGLLRCAKPEAAPFRGVSSWLDGAAVEELLNWVRLDPEPDALAVRAAAADAWDPQDAANIADEIWGF